jgi:hypothetical protein
VTADSSCTLPFLLCKSAVSIEEVDRGKSIEDVDRGCRSGLVIGLVIGLPMQPATTGHRRSVWFGAVRWLATPAVRDRSIKQAVIGAGCSA